MTPAKGFRFYHSRVLDPERGNAPMLYEVSRVARGTVYYRPIHADGLLGKPACCPVEDFGRYCLRPAEPQK